MSTLHIGVGMMVCFRSKVFAEPYAPYYDAYKGHHFQVVAIHYGDHVELKCVTDPNLMVDGFVHNDELKQL